MTYPHTCIVCGTTYETTRKDSKYCSKRCSNKATRKQIQSTCSACGKQFIATREGCTTCSNACKAKKTSKSPSYRRAMRKRNKTTKPKQGTLFPASEIKSGDDWLKKLSPLNRAWTEHDSATFFRVLKANSIVDENGCWNWTGTIDKSGYPRASLGGTSYKALHRASLEMRYGKPLGSQQAHHICGNSHCVNPNHIEPATAAQNVGEMLARRSYEQRIKELENELKKLDPNNELLNRIKYGTD